MSFIKMPKYLATNKYQNKDYIIQHLRFILVFCIMFLA